MQTPLFKKRTLRMGVKAKNIQIYKFQRQFFLKWWIHKNNSPCSTTLCIALLKTIIWGVKEKSTGSMCCTLRGILERQTVREFLHRVHVVGAPHHLCRRNRNTFSPPCRHVWGSWCLSTRPLEPWQDEISLISWYYFAYFFILFYLDIDCM